MPAKQSPRRRAPRDIEERVLTQCRRRCALCFHLHRDTTEKKGQIAHLDRRRTNNDEDNLAFLCLPHHSEYDSKTSQHKNYTIGEVKRARSGLFRWISRGMPLLEATKVRKAATHAMPQKMSTDTNRPPKIRVVGYGPSPDGWEALHIKNDGTPAHDVRVEPIRLAEGWHLRFDDLSHLETRGYCRSWISRDSRGITTLDGLWTSLHDPQPVMPVCITCKDFEGQAYRSFAELHRDVRKKSGFDVKFVRQQPYNEPQPLGPTLRYGGISSGGSQAFSRGVFNVQVASIRNAQVSIKNTAHNVRASIEYEHTGGETFTITPALWLENRIRAHVVNLSGNEAQALIILLQDDTGKVFASLDEHHFERELEIGHWSIRLTIAADNCESLRLAGGFTLVLDEGRIRLVYDKPALREAR